MTISTYRINRSKLGIIPYLIEILDERLKIIICLCFHKLISVNNLLEEIDTLEIFDIGVFENIQLKDIIENTEKISTLDPFELSDLIIKLKSKFEGKIWRMEDYELLDRTLYLISEI